MPKYRVDWRETYYMSAVVEAPNNDSWTIKEAIANMPEFHTEEFDGEVNDMNITVSGCEEEDDD